MNEHTELCVNQLKTTAIDTLRELKNIRLLLLRSYRDLLTAYQTNLLAMNGGLLGQTFATNSALAIELKSLQTLIWRIHTTEGEVFS